MMFLWTICVAVLFDILRHVGCGQAWTTDNRNNVHAYSIRINAYKSNIVEYLTDHFYNDNHANNTINIHQDH